MLDAPRWPASADAAWPAPELLDALTPGGGEVARQAATVRAQARAALDDLLAHRPGGAGWEQARQADRDTLMAGDGSSPTAVADLLDQDADRYGVALAECSTVTHRLAGLRAALPADVMAEAADAALAEARKTVGVAAHRAESAARQGDKATAYALLRDLDAEVARARALFGVRRWLVGEDTTYDPGPRLPLPKATLDAVTDAREILDGVPAEQRRTSRELAHMQRANFAARVEGRELPHPEVAGSQRDQLAGVHPVRAGAAR